MITALNFVERYDLDIIDDLLHLCYMTLCLSVVIGAIRLYAYQFTNDT
jgi:hypothetical protein